MIVYDLDTFVQLPQEKLAEVTTLFLPNSHLQGIFDNEPDYPKFMQQLRGAINLTHVNLRNNGLSKKTLEEIKQQLQSRPGATQSLKTPNIYDNPGAAATLPLEMEMPNGWILNGSYSEAEFLEMIAVAEQMHKDHPDVVKFHAHRAPSEAKFNLKLRNPANMQTNLPFSAVITTNGTVVIIPKYKSIPRYAHNSRTRYPLLKYGTSNKFKGKRLRIVFTRDQERLDPMWAQIGISAVDNAYESQQQILFLSNQPMLFSSRAVGYAARVETPYRYVQLNDVFKNYHITKLGNEDALEYLDRIENGSEKPIITEQHLLIIFSILMATMCWHNLGLLHLDIKTSNLMICNNDPTDAYLIDYEFSRPLLINERIIYPLAQGTISHLPPEIEDKEAPFYSYGFDYYACGISICSIFIPRIETDDRNKLILVTDALAEIATEYSDVPQIKEILDVLRGLTARNPDQRFSAQHAFMELSEVLPSFGKATITTKHKKLVTELQQECALYPQARAIIDIIAALPLGADMTANLNLIFKLQLVSYYMNLFRLAGDEPPNTALFQRSVEELMRQPNKPITECTDRYYLCKDVEEAITKLHNDSGKHKAKRMRA